MIGGITATAVAVLIVVMLVYRGGTGRVGMLVIFAAGSAVGFAGTLWDLVLSLLGVAAQIVNSLAGAAG